MNGSNGSKKLGNTTRVSPAKRWCFTLNNWSQEEFEKLKTVLGSNGSYIIGEEVGEKKKTPHLQGYVHFSKKLRPLSLDLPKRIHWEKCKGTEQENIDYCSKEKVLICTFTIVVKKKIIREKKILKLEEMYLWEHWLLKRIDKTPKDRIIYWIWESKGNYGKTTFARYLVNTYDAAYVKGKKADILYTASLHDYDIYIIDLARVVEDRVPYEAIEDLKNGLFHSGKYESAMKDYAPPHVIIFANFPPVIEGNLSKDKVIVKELKPLDKTIPYFTHEDGKDVKS